MKKFTYFTSEFVSPGHPDKVSDQISDAVLDACLKDDPNSRVACEVFCTTGLVVVGGEITTSTYIDVQDIVRKKIDEIGYRPGMGFDSNCGTLSCIHAQSPDIAMGVDIGGAGDQGIMFGGAVRETEELMPLALVLSREILVKLTNMMKNKHLSKAIQEQNFYSIRTKLINKCKERNIELRIVDTFYPSSKTCSCCGSIKKDLKLSNRIYKCCNCGLEMDRDYNASINLKKAKIYKVIA